MAERVIIGIEIDLDPVPGAFHTYESAQATIQTILTQRLPHYHPLVLEPQEADS